MWWCVVRPVNGQHQCYRADTKCSPNTNKQHDHLYSLPPRQRLIVLHHVHWHSRIYASSSSHTDSMHQTTYCVSHSWACLVKFIVVLKTDLFPVIISDDAQINDIIRCLKFQIPNQHNALHFEKILVWAVRLLQASRFAIALSASHEDVGELIND